MKIRVLVISTALGISVGANAAPETYYLDPVHTYPYFEIAHMGVSIQRGRFDRSSGKAVIDRAAKKGSIEFTIESASVNTGSENRDKHIKEPDFLYVTKFPTISFKSDKLKFDGDTVTGADGELTLLGTTKPLSITVTSFKCGYDTIMDRPLCGADVSAAIKRSDFGMTHGLPKTVGDDIRLSIQVEARP